jgi:hypothetical protein
MTFNRIHQAVNEKDWALVKELAEKFEANAQAKRLADAARDPESVTISILGRNGQKLEYRYSVPLGEEVVLEQEYNQGEPECIGWGYYSGSRIAGFRTPDVRLRVNLQIKKREN